METASTPTSTVLAPADIVLMPVADLLDGRSFFVPDYQRGYRWTSQQVEELLQDLLLFAMENKASASTEYYCLQPVVVRRNGKSWEVIDGQQRLTTIKILLHWLKQKIGEDDWVNFQVTPYSIEYATRTETTKFIDSLDKTNCKHQDGEPIDFYHIKEAYNTIEKWFSSNGPALCRQMGEDPGDAVGFIRKLLILKQQPNSRNPNARILWFEADPSESGIELFNRLNTNRLGLTDAELVKGLFMLKANAGTENEQFARGVSWEKMENALHDDAFWRFLTPRGTERTNRIDLLLELVVRTKLAASFSQQAPAPNTEEEKQLERKIDSALAKDHAVFNFYNNRLNVDLEQRQATIKKDFSEIERAFRVLEDWFSDPIIYNLVGYLCHTSTAKMRILFNKFQEFRNEGKTRKDFIAHLNEIIHNDLYGISVSETRQDDKPESDYEIDLSYDDLAQVRKLLLLLNVVHLNKRAASEDIKSGEREICKFPFAVLGCGKGKNDKESNGWDIEHVDSRTANTLEKSDDRREWIMTSLKDLSSVLEKGEWDSLCADVGRLAGSARKFGEKGDERWEELEKMLESKENADRDGQIIQRIQAAACEKDADGEGGKPSDRDNIGNLVLLDQKTNRSYKNALFITKRRKIIHRREEGQYVPETTSYVFFKLIEDRANNRWMWTREDMRCYTNYIVKQLTKNSGDYDYLRVPKTSQPSVSSEE